MKCLIIAAGKGTRIKPRGKVKPLVPLLGTPLIERVIRSAIKGGANEFFVVTGYERQKVDRFLRDLVERSGIPITVIHNKDWRKKNGLSVLRAGDILQEPFLLLMADHLFDPAIVRMVSRQPLDAGDVRLAVDTDMSNPLVDLQDVTKVYIKGDRIHDIGKAINDFNAFDTGIFFCTPALFEVLNRLHQKSGDMSLSAAIRSLANQKHAKIVRTDRFWIDIDDEKICRKAEEILRRLGKDKTEAGRSAS